MNSMKLSISDFTIHHALSSKRILDEYRNVLFRDMGGKDTGIRFSVSLRDQNNEKIIIDENMSGIRVEVRCKYEGETETNLDASVIEVDTTHSKDVIDSNGVAFFRIRFRTISRQHGNRRFVLEAFCPDQNDISASLTTPIKVLTKCNTKNISSSKSAESTLPTSLQPPPSPECVTEKVESVPRLRGKRSNEREEGSYSKFPRKTSLMSALSLMKQWNRHGARYDPLSRVHFPYVLPKHWTTKTENGTAK